MKEELTELEKLKIEVKYYKDKYEQTLKWAQESKTKYKQLLKQTQKNNKSVRVTHEGTKVFDNTGGWGV